MAFNYHRRHQMKHLAEQSAAAASAGDAEGSPGSSGTQNVNHCEEWNPNQIVYNKVSYWNQIIPLL